MFWFKSSLFYTTTISKYVPETDFVNTVIPRHSFDTLWECISLPDQPDTRPEGMLYEADWWQLIDAFVKIQ